MKLIYFMALQVINLFPEVIKMFIGEYSHSLDAKGRLIVPAKFREELGEHFIMTKGIDKCLYIYPRSEWEIFENKLRELPLANANARRFTRFFLSGAVECDTDNQGRIIIPQSLRNHAGLTKEVVSAGVGTKIEVWSKDNWEAECNPDNLDDSIVESMGLFGI